MLNKKLARLVEELGGAAAEPVATDHKDAKTLKVVFGNSKLYSADVHQQAEDVEPVLVENEEVPAAAPAVDVATAPLPAEATVEVDAATAEEGTDVKVTDDSIVIEIPVHSGEEVNSDMTPAETEVVKEALRVIYTNLVGGFLNEEEGTLEVPADAEATVEVHDDKIVVEIPAADKPVEEVSEKVAEEIQEAVNAMEFVVKKGRKNKKVAKKAAAKKLAEPFSLWTSKKTKVSKK
jgi:hypothetical protein